MNPSENTSSGESASKSSRPLRLVDHPWATPVLASVSQVLVAALCAVALAKGLLPGLLAVCLGFLATRGLARLTAERRFPAAGAAAIVILAPLLALCVVLLNAKGVTLSLMGQYRELLQHLAKTVLDIREKLPADMAKSLPEGTAAIQQWLAEHLRAQASGIAVVGKDWLHGTLLAYVGLVVGSLIAVRGPNEGAGPLSRALAQRAANFLDAFRQIVAAQFWIAAFNTVLTALFLLVALPIAGIHLPYVYALVALTFCAGMVPIVGNLLCNAVLAVVGVSVSPMVGLSCLTFLIAIHKTEYFINARVVGSRTKTAAWELLTVMFAFEALFGVAGLVAAPLYYAYLKKELKDAALI